MNTLLAADGSRFTKKALTFLMANRELWSSVNTTGSTLHVIHVQPRLPTHVRSKLGKGMIYTYQADEAEKVLGPVKKYLDLRGIDHNVQWVVGDPGDEILKAAKRCDAHMIAMGSHGRSALGNLVMGSVAQRVLAGSDIPVLLVK
jgi:nucleotide-binding universal stress UspA family protein